MMFGYHVLYFILNYSTSEALYAGKHAFYFSLDLTEAIKEGDLAAQIAKGSNMLFKSIITDKYCSEQIADLNLALKASHVKCDNNPIRYEQQQQSFDPMHYP